GANITPTHPRQVLPRRPRWSDFILNRLTPLRSNRPLRRSQLSQGGQCSMRGPGVLPVGRTCALPTTAAESNFRRTTACPAPSFATSSHLVSDGPFCPRGPTVVTGFR